MPVTEHVNFMLRVSKMFILPLYLKLITKLLWKQVRCISAYLLFDISGANARILSRICVYLKKGTIKKRVDEKVSR